MGWFKNIIKNIMSKEASKEEIKNRALQQIQQNIDPRSIAVQFIMQMSQEDPEFARGGWAKSFMDASVDINTLSDALTSFNTGEEVEPVIETPFEQTPQIPINQAPIDSILEEDVESKSIILRLEAPL